MELKQVREMLDGKVHYLNNFLFCTAHVFTSHPNTCLL